MRSFQLFIVFGVAGFLAAMAVLDAQAVNKPGNSAEQYRAPWPEGESYYRDGGCPVMADTSLPGQADCGFHEAGTQYEWAIDLNRTSDQCGVALKADRSGSTVFFQPGEIAPSSYLGILHGGSPQRSSWYVHVEWQDDAVVFRDGDWKAWDDLYVQGDFAARKGDVGSEGACHLHFSVSSGSSSSAQSVNVCMSGDCNTTGWDLQTLSDEQWDQHASNNTGPGYGQPGVPPHADPGPDNQPLSAPVRTRARLSVALGGDPGSTFGSPQAPCITNRRWVKRCSFGSGGFGYTQNFMKPTGAFLVLPRSITEGPNGAQVIQDVMWKAYQFPCTSSLRTYQLIGKPLGAEDAFGVQQFQFGEMIRLSGPDPTSVAILVSAGSTSCSFLGLNTFYTGPCWSFPFGSAVFEDNSVAAPDFFAVLGKFGLEISMTSWDERYDTNLDEAVGAQDFFRVLGRFGTTCDY